MRRGAWQSRDLLNVKCSGWLVGHWNQIYMFSWMQGYMVNVPLLFWAVSALQGIRSESSYDCLGSEGDDVLGPRVFWDGWATVATTTKGALRWWAFLLPPYSLHSLGLLIGDRERKKREREGARDEKKDESLSHSFENSSHMPGFLWEDWPLLYLAKCLVWAH